MDDRQTTKRRLALAAASVVVPLAVVLLSLPQGRAGLLLAFVGGVAASLVLVELGERHVSLGPTTAQRGIEHDRLSVGDRYAAPANDIRR